MDFSPKLSISASMVLICSGVIAMVRISFRYFTRTTMTAIIESGHGSTMTRQCRVLFFAGMARLYIFCTTGTVFLRACKNQIPKPIKERRRICKKQKQWSRRDERAESLSIGSDRRGVGNLGAI